MNRRSFLSSCLALSAAPAIVRAESLMRLVVPGESTWFAVAPAANYWWQEYGFVVAGASARDGVVIIMDVKQIALPTEADIARFKSSAHEEG